MATSTEETRNIVEQINDLIQSLPQKGDSVVFLAVDGSWGDAANLRLSLDADLDDEDRENYEMDE